MHPDDVSRTRLLAEIFAWVGDWEVDWRVDWVRTVALAYGFDAALPLAGKHE